MRDGVLWKLSPEDWRAVLAVNLDAPFELTRLVAEVAEGDLEEALKSVADNQKTYEPRPADAKAESGDQLVIDYVGRIDGVEFEGGKGEEQGQGGGGERGRAQGVTSICAMRLLLP